MKKKPSKKRAAAKMDTALLKRFATLEAKYRELAEAVHYLQHPEEKPPEPAIAPE